MVSFCVLFFDQAIKFALVNKATDFPVFENHNALFGVPYDQRFAMIFISIILAYLIHQRRKILASLDGEVAISTGLILGGILGNTADRIDRGFVVDYLTIPGYFSFNISDLTILFGSVLFLLKIIRK